MSDDESLDNNQKAKKEIKKECFFILDYPANKHCDKPEVKGLKENIPFLKDKINISKIDSGIIKEIKYDVFKVSIESNEDEKELYLHFKYDQKQKYEILLKINGNIIFFFDMEIEEYKYKIYHIINKYKHNIFNLDRLIIFKRAIKKINYEQKQELLIKQSLLYNKEKTYHFLLNLFCISKDSKANKEIINCFYNNITMGNPSLLEDEEKDTIKDHMDKVEKNPDSYIDFESLSKVHFYVTFILCRYGRNGIMDMRIIPCR